MKLRHTIQLAFVIIAMVSCKQKQENTIVLEDNKTEATTIDTTQTYINPLDIDYTYMVYNSARNQSYRSGADPAVIEFKGEYYMFVTRSFGYWHSTDLVNWKLSNRNNGFLKVAMRQQLSIIKIL